MEPGESAREANRNADLERGGLFAAPFALSSGSAPSTTHAAPTAPGLPQFSLIARIGSTGTPFYVGNGGTFLAETLGLLELGVNDSSTGSAGYATGFDNNNGSWSATIQTGTSPSPTPSSTP